TRAGVLDVRGAGHPAGHGAADHAAPVPPAGWEASVMSDGAPLVEMSGIRKSYGGVVALDGVDFSVGDAEIVALLGDNGAGKSTLIKVLSGVTQPDQGVIRLHGKPVRFRTSKD